MKNFALILGAIVFLTGAVNGKHVVTVGQEIPTLTEQKAEPQGADPVEIMKKFQTIEVQTGTWLAKPEMCEGKLQKKKEFEQWGLFFVRGRTADVVLKIDHQPGWFYYQYSFVHPRSGLVLSSGNVTAWDGLAACGQVADIIVDKLKKVRATPEAEEKRKKEEEKNKKKEEAPTKTEKGKETPPA
ncbi:MAG TPA: hypothetical protein VKD70_03190 [Candidatus Acidoferrum sp.]|nr:hypothetical protein [Candidatus Acidoferrum sp.]